MENGKQQEEINKQRTLKDLCTIQILCNMLQAIRIRIRIYNENKIIKMQFIRGK